MSLELVQRLKVCSQAGACKQASSGIHEAWGMFVLLEGMINTEPGSVHVPYHGRVSSGRLKATASNTGVQWLWDTPGKA